MLLPQGDFARFLRADAEARGKLLGRLFDTRRFADVEKRLAERRRATEAQVREGDATLLADAHRMQQAAGDAMELPELAPGEPGLAEAVLSAAAVARSTARELLAVADCRLSAAESAQAAAERDLAGARELDRLQRRFAEARERAARLAERADAHRAAQERMERARKAEAVAPALELRDAADADHRRARRGGARVPCCPRTSRTPVPRDSPPPPAGPPRNWAGWTPPAGPNSASVNWSRSGPGSTGRSAPTRTSAARGRGLARRLGGHAHRAAGRRRLARRKRRPAPNSSPCSATRHSGG